MLKPIILIALSSLCAAAQTLSTEAVAAPPTPTELQIPAGNVAFLKGHAEGTQDYICLPSASGFSWTFFSPQATLFLSFKGIRADFQQQVVTHFLSPNPSENNTSRATWQSSVDTSRVWGKMMASVINPAVVATGAIPWLLLQAVGAANGPTGGDYLAHTTFVQRLNTAGGVAPATGCGQASNVGATALVPYSADYYFYRASRK